MELSGSEDAAAASTIYDDGVVVMQRERVATNHKFPHAIYFIYFA